MGSNAHLCSLGWKLFIHVKNQPPRYPHVSPVQETRQTYGPIALPENGVWDSQGASPALLQPPRGIFSVNLKKTLPRAKRNSSNRAERQGEGRGGREAGAYRCHQTLSSVPRAPAPCWEKPGTPPTSPPRPSTCRHLLMMMAPL